MKQSKYNKKFTENINKAITQHSIPNKVIAELLKVSETSIKYKRSGRTEWFLDEACKLALYFSQPLDVLAFGSKDFVEKETARFIAESNEIVKQFLIDNGHTNILGKLTADGTLK